MTQGQVDRELAAALEADPTVKLHREFNAKFNQLTDARLRHARYQQNADQWLERADQLQQEYDEISRQIRALIDGDRAGC